MKIRNNVKSLLARRGMKSYELAAALGISVPSTSLLVSNKTESIKFSQMVQLCDILKCLPSELFELVEGE